MARWRAAPVAALLVLVACSRSKEDPVRAAAAPASAGPSASAFVWPLAAQADAGEHAAPRKGMIWIPPGILVAGTPRDRTPRLADEELPGEPVELAGFYIDEFAYPNEAGGIPKTGMTRDEAAGLCSAQEKRLCTELEWERACKGPSNTTYEYGETYRAAECAMGQTGRLAPSGLRVACKSGFGIHDMHGGPWEWTSSAWRRGTGLPSGVARGGNSDAGELVGRCANALAAPVASKRSDISVRCCAGEANTAEVKLSVVRGKTFEPRLLDPALAERLAGAVREKGLPEPQGDEPFRIDRIWSWHPVGNEELVVAAGCSRRSPHLACGVGVFRERGDPAEGGGAMPVLVGFASSGWWMAVVKTHNQERDLWVYGGDGNWSFRRRIAYVWGRIALGDAEKSTPHGLTE
jgi:formylglycine-generating enzyme required for sulfatase activity